ncbi:MAG: polysaccharide-degrading enzyme [Planctomycetaceae bacterium]|nr:MAG: polysaccharide-degrading enzyme [Planctomycetaceae bacterium]
MNDIQQLLRAVGAAAILLVPTTAPAADYRVGPAQPLSEVEEVPWESLRPGDRVLIHARPEPYRSKWVLTRRGTADAPITITGIPDATGRLPVIDGRNAVTRRELNFWGEERGVIKIGGANRPADLMPAHIVIENLDVRSGRQPYFFTGRSGKTAYLKNAASIFIEKGEHITLRGCELHDSGNGLFSSPNTKSIVVEHCSIFDNGVEGSILEHNNYTNSQGITFQFNHFGPLREGCPGNNLKDRSSGMIVRYNWIEGGNRCLDLVDGAHQASEAYGNTYVYGNVLMKPDDHGNNQVVHYGGDSDDSGRYRKGTLHFFHNTVVSYRTGTTVLFRLSTADESVECRNNVFYVSAPGRHLAILAEGGRADLFRNWIKPGWRVSHGGQGGQVRGIERLIEGDAPGFADDEDRDYRPVAGAPVAGAAEPLPPGLNAAHSVAFEYIPHRRQTPRPQDKSLSLGAFEPALR